MPSPVSACERRQTKAIRRSGTKRAGIGESTLCQAQSPAPSSHDPPSLRPTVSSGLSHDNPPDATPIVTPRHARSDSGHNLQ